MSVAGAARAGSAAATGRAAAVARTRKPFLVVPDLDHTEALGNCADAAQYVNVVRIRTAHKPAHSPAGVSVIHVETMSNHIAGMFAPGAPIVIEYQRNDLSSSGTSSIARLGSTSIGGGRAAGRTRPASRLTSSATFFAVIATVLRMRNGRRQRYSSNQIRNERTRTDVALESRSRCSFPSCSRSGCDGEPACSSKATR